MNTKIFAKIETKKLSPIQKSKMKFVWGIMKGKIVETEDCWTEDLQRTIH